MKEEIKETEKYFEKVSINNKNYFPEYIKNLQKEEKEQINEIIYNKINTFNLAVTRRNTIRKEINNILSKSKKKKLNKNNINSNKSNYINTMENIIFSNRTNRLNNNKNHMFVLKEDATINNNKESPKIIKIINNSKNKKKKNITLKKNNEEDNNYFNTNSKKHKSFKNDELKTINLSKDFADKRFLGYKNEFDKKYNEFKRPLELLLRRNSKNYSKLNKLSFNNFNSNSNHINREF